jgi:hypothetical protein
VASTLPNVLLETGRRWDDGKVRRQRTESDDRYGVNNRGKYFNGVTEMRLEGSDAQFGNLWD